MNWFQQGYSPAVFSDTCGTVEACISAYAQTVAQCPVLHYKVDANGVKTRIPNSNVARLLARPNGYQTRSDFLLNLVNSLLKNGNAYFYGDGETPRSHTQLVLLDPRMTEAQRVAQSSEHFYRTSGEFAEMGDLINPIVIPSRYVGHFRLFTPIDPLKGVTPLSYAAQSIAANNAITSSQATFFSNMSRPSGVLSTEAKLTKEQATVLRESWEEQSKSLNNGGVPVLSNGLEWKPLSITSQDAEMVSAWRMTIEEISRVFRVPPMIINNMENATFNNAEALMSFWLSSGLGFLIGHMEEVFATFFRLPPDETITLDTTVLMRSDLQTLIKSLGEGVTKGLYSPKVGNWEDGSNPSLSRKIGTFLKN